VVRVEFRGELRLQFGWGGAFRFGHGDRTGYRLQGAPVSLQPGGSSRLY
jgi:hypothetical protein